MMTSTNLIRLIGILGLLLMASPAISAEAVYFRSDHGLVTSGSGPLPDDFANARSLQWKQSMDLGHSTPCVFNDRVFLTTYRVDPPELATVAVDIQTGRILWRQTAPRNKIESFHKSGSPAAASPACDGERVYSFFGSFGLLCYDLDGKQIWSKPMGPFQDEFGAASSPVLADNTVLLNQDHDINNQLVAIDKFTGRTIWEVERNEFTRSYATPIVWTSNGTRQIVVPGALTLTGYSLETGKRLWWVHGLARIVNTMPAIGDDILYMASWAPGGDSDSRIGMEPWDQIIQKVDKNGDGRIVKEELPEGNPAIERFFRIDLNQNQALEKDEWERHAVVFERAENQIMAIRSGGEGDLTNSQVIWKFGRGIPYVASPVLHQDTLFMIKDGGILTTLDAGTGQLGKQGRVPGRGNYYASPVVGDGKCYLASEQGTVSVVSAERDWKVLSSHDFGDAIYATPVVAQDRMLIRTNSALYCFLKAK